jgi:hypothetical protein
VTPDVSGALGTVLIRAQGSASVSIGRGGLVAQARANPLENFRLVFADRFIKSIVERMDDNADIFGRILDDSTFQSVVMDHYLQRVFERARGA